MSARVAAQVEARVAVLVDCDNTSPEVLEFALRVVAQFGRVVLRRGYGNHATLANRWQEALVRSAFTPCLQYQYASGKDTSDIALAAFADLSLIDAYDVYQHPMDYWAQTMQDDAYLIAADGWGWVAKTSRILETDKKGRSPSTCQIQITPSRADCRRGRCDVNTAGYWAVARSEMRPPEALWPRQATVVRERAMERFEPSPMPRRRPAGSFTTLLTRLRLFLLGTVVTAQREVGCSEFLSPPARVCRPRSGVWWTLPSLYSGLRSSATDGSGDGNEAL